MRPARSSASSPKPQKKSARTGPRIAPPVSCAIVSRRSGSSDSGCVVAMNTGNGNADGGKGTGGDADANGGFAKSGDATVVNVAVVKQDSDQEMKVWDNDKWTSLSFELKKRHSW